MKGRPPNPPEPDLSEAVERLVQEGREALPRRPSGREITVEVLAGGLFLVTAIMMAALLPSQGSFSPSLAVAFAIAYAFLARIRFEVGEGSAVPTQVLFVPMLFELPARTVPLVVASALLLAALPDFLTGRKHVVRALSSLGDSWFAVGPALILSLAGADYPAWSDWPIYLGALGAQLAFDIVASTVRVWLGLGVNPRLQLGVLSWVYLIDVLLSPLGLLAAFASSGQSYAFLLLLPLAGLFVIFARERRVRIDNALGLSRAYRETAELNARLLETERAASRAREELIAGASHEMQTPLAVLLGLLDATGRGDVPPERQTEMYASMRRQASRLRHLVSQFIDYTRLKSGRPLRIDPRPSDIRPIVEEVAEAQRGYAPIELDLPEDLPAALVDPARLQQVLMNLVSNAVKFSPEGSPTTIAARSLGESVEISVIDRGGGIDASKLPRLFDEFHHSDEEEIDPEAGAGLGLYMSRMLTEPQSGRVTVQSRPGEGSCFTIVLPRATSG